LLEQNTVVHELGYIDVVYNEALQW